MADYHDTFWGENNRHQQHSNLLPSVGHCSAFRRNHIVLSALLKSCSTSLNIKVGKGLHGYATKLGLISCQLVSKAVLNVYSKCEYMPECLEFFHQLGNCDSVAWNIVLSGFAGVHCHDFDVMRLVCSMQASYDSKPNSVTMAIVLPVCAGKRNIFAGKSVHCYAIKSGFSSEVLTGNALTSFYSKCGLVYPDASAAFSSIDCKDVVSWNAIISGLSENSFGENALTLLRLMLKGMVQPNEVTVLSALSACSSLSHNRGYKFGQEIHCYVQKRVQMAEDVSVTNGLLSFYFRVGCVGEAETLFSRMSSKDRVSWNAVIAGYTSNCQYDKALALFCKSVSSKVIAPDVVTLISVLPTCTDLNSLSIGKQIHSYILHRDCLHKDDSLSNTLINFYAKCSDHQSALHVFLGMVTRNIISWNTMLDALVASGEELKFLKLFRWMIREGPRPDAITLMSIIRFCVNFFRPKCVKEVHSYLIRGSLLLFGTRITLGNALLDAYAKCGSIEYAIRVFEFLSEFSCNSTSCSSLSYDSYNDYCMSFDWTEEMITWNLMIRVYVENDNPHQALRLFRKLQVLHGKPGVSTMMSIISLCARTSSICLLKQVHGYIIRSCFEDLYLIGALLDGYSKCGFLATACTLFQSTPSKDVIIYTAMIGGYAMHGMCECALRTYYDMLNLGMKPDHVTLVTALSACSRAGMVEEGKKIFNSIEGVYGMKPTVEHYASAVDLLSRGGKVKDAYDFVSGMPVKAGASIWGTLLGACVIHQEVELGCSVATHLLDVEAKDIGNYVVMSNLLAADARWDGVLQIRKLMKARCWKKPAGCSWVEVNGVLNIFIAGDSSHSVRVSVYNALDSLDKLMKDPLLVLESPALWLIS